MKKKPRRKKFGDGPGPHYLVQARDAVCAGDFLKFEADNGETFTITPSTAWARKQFIKAAKAFLKFVEGEEDATT